MMNIWKLLILTYDNNKSHKKKQGFTLSLENTVLEKPQGRGSNWPPENTTKKNPEIWNVNPNMIFP